jgi:hypothetical protein
MLGYPGEYKRGILLIDAGPGIIVTFYNSATKQFEAVAII